MSVLAELVDGRELTEAEATNFMEELMSGEISEGEAAAYLTALRIRGETPLEIASFAKVMRAHAVQVKPNVKNLVDVVGTGGDCKNTFNISTAAMFVAAGAGAYVAKHGNRSITSKCGSADVLEALGASLEMTPEDIASCIEETGVGFMFAPRHHPAMKHVMPIRKKLGFRTVFNILGPLTNPANAKGQLVGVFDPNLTEPIARVFQILGLERALVVNGNPGLDEISTLGHTKISELRNGEIETRMLDPETLGFKTARLEDIQGSDAAGNAKLIREVLKGETGPKRDIVVLNTAGALIAAGLADDFQDGIVMADKSMDSGKAMKVLEDFIEFTKKVA